MGTPIRTPEHGKILSTRLRPEPPMMAVTLISLVVLMSVLAAQAYTPGPVQVPVPTGVPQPLTAHKAHVLALELGSKVSLDGGPVSAEQLPGLLQDKAQQAKNANVSVILRIQGNARLPYAQIQQTVAMAHAAGFEQVQLETAASPLPGVAGTDRGLEPASVQGRMPISAPTGPATAPITP